MSSSVVYPIEIERCRHIRMNGTRCGSPAMKGKQRCYYHDQNRPGPVQLYMDGARYTDERMVLPVLEDAHSIQTTLRQVVQLLMARKIERKDASLMLYALQIAASNLKTMAKERAEATEMVVEVETPEEGNGERDAGERKPVAYTADEQYEDMSKEERDRQREFLLQKGKITEDECRVYLANLGRDPLLDYLRKKWTLCGGR